VARVQGVREIAAHREQLAAGEVTVAGTTFFADPATIAAHTQHLRYGLSLMNRWAEEGGNPFADAKWDAAWKIAAVDAGTWDEIRSGLHGEAHRWLAALGTSREASDVELTGMIASIAHFAYHLGAIRQIAKDARGPKEGTF